MSNSFPIIFLILAAVVLVFGFGVVVQSRRKKPTPVVAPAPKKVVAPAPVVEVVEEPVAEKKRSFKNVLAGAVSSVLGRGEINDTSYFTIIFDLCAIGFLYSVSELQDRGKNLDYPEWSLAP